MTRFSTILLLLVLSTIISSHAQNVIFNRGFDDTNPFVGFVLENIDRATPSDTNWKTLADSAFIARTAGNALNKAAIATSAYATSKSANDWLITPGIRLGKASRLSFSFKSLTSGKNESLEIYISTTEQTSGGCKLNPVLHQIISNQSDNFENASIDLAAAGYRNEKVYIGFRYNTLSGDKIAIDNLKVVEDSTQFVNLTFVVNMTNYKAAGKFDPRKHTVDVAGNFNDWEGKQNLLSLIPSSDSSIYSTTISGFLDGDELQFKFRINSTWNDSIIEFPYGKPNRLWKVEAGKYTYQCYYNDQGTTFNIPDAGLMSEVNVFPNPARELVQIELPQAITQVKLYSLEGKQIQSIQINSEKTAMDITGLKPSTYILLFYSDTRFVGSRKLLKQ